MSAPDNVLRLADYSPSPTCDMKEWAIDWLVSIMEGEYGDVKSLCIVVENTQGEVNHVCQSIGKMDGYRMIGLLTHLASRIGTDCDG